MIEICKEYVFNYKPTPNSFSVVLNQKNNQKCVVLSFWGENEHGKLYKVRFPDNFWIYAFEHELSTIN